MNAERKDGKPTEKSRQEYIKVVKSAQLKEILLLSSSFDVDRSFLESAEPDEDGDVKLGFTCGAEVPDVRYDATEGIFTGQFDWYAKADKDDHVAIDIRGSYGIVYQCDRDLEKGAVQSFVLRVGKFATFPYFRQLAAFYATSASLGLPILPVLKE